LRNRDTFVDLGDETKFVPFVFEEYRKALDLFRGARTMLTRRQALAILGATGIGTSVFQRALAAKAAEGSVTPQMVADAEWVAGIQLTAAQREAAANGNRKESTAGRGTGPTVIFCRPSIT
jgi:hypothetical protein